MISGIDIGSRFVKIATFSDDKELKFALYDTTGFYGLFCKMNNKLFTLDLEKLGFSNDDKIAVTGYGRERAKILGVTEIPEIQAHTLGVQELLNITDFVLIDLGGQDTKIANVKNGKVVDFLASDRCAASTGRFLENMAHILGISIQQLGNFTKNPAKIDSTCAVFAETELLEKITRGVSIEEICAGINLSIVHRFSILVRKFLPAKKIVATGGVSLNNAIIKLLENELECQVVVPPNSQFAGAIGCIRFLKQNN